MFRADKQQASGLEVKGPYKHPLLEIVFVIIVIIDSNNVEWCWPFRSFRKRTVNPYLVISHHLEELRISVLSEILLTLEKARKQL